MKIKKRPEKSGNCSKCGTWRQVLCRDHIKPRREGGTNDPLNIQMLCANCHQDKTSKEQSAAHKGRPKSPEQRAKMSAWQVGIPKPQNVRDKISATLAGRSIPIEVRLKMSAAHKGRIVTDETKKKISIALKGRKPRPTHCPNGHPYDEENSRIDKHGSSRCIICFNARRRAARTKSMIGNAANE